MLVNSMESSDNEKDRNRVEDIEFGFHNLSLNEMRQLMEEQSASQDRFTAILYNFLDECIRVNDSLQVGTL